MHKETIETTPEPGQQIGCIVPQSGHTAFLEVSIADEEAKGNVVVRHAGFAAVHAPAPVKQAK